LPRLTEIMLRPAETNASRTDGSAQKNLAEMHALLQGFRGYTRGCASAPPQNVTTFGSEESPNRKHQTLWVPTDTAAKAQGLLSGIAIGVP
jgi:hypothetical protein